jgi:ATP-binding cassette, subfamily B, bacterial
MISGNMGSCALRENSFLSFIAGTVSLEKVFVNTGIKVPYINIKNTISKNRLAGLWKMMKGFRSLFLLATICLAISAVAKSSTYLLIQYYVDNVLGQFDQRKMLPLVALGFLLLAAFEGGFSFLSGRMASKTAEGITYRLRNYLFDHIQRLSFTYHSKTPTGELIQRSTSDVDAIRRFYSDQAIGVGRILILFIINFSLIYRLNSTLAWISIISIPFILATSIFFFRKVSKAYEKFQEQEAVLSTTLQENLTGVRVVKAFARQEYEKDKFNKDSWEKFLRGRRMLLLHSTFWPTSDIICSLQMLAGYFICAMMVINGTVTIGTYMAYAGLLTWLIWPMRNLGRLIVQASSGLVSYNRVVDVIRPDEELLDEAGFSPDSDLHGHLVFDNVCFRYEEDNLVLQDISFEVKPGQVVALLGSTGSGKTTLVNLLPRFFDYTCGHLMLDGTELTDYPRSFLRSQIGIVEQEPFLFSRTIRENITYGVGRNVSIEEIETAAKAAAIHDVIVTFPEGYETLVGEKGVTLSGGQKQRVTIARTLLKAPRILILDDSTSSVDTETEAEIRSALEFLMKDRTTFIIAHRIQSVMDADLILVLDKGRIVQKGTHAQLVATEGIYRKIFDIQTQIETELEKEITGFNQQLVSTGI